MQQQMKIKNKQGENLVGVFHKANNKKQVVIVCHGWTGNKDGPLIKSVCIALNKAGYNSFRFDFSGNGKSEGKFEDSTFSKEVQDLKAVIDHFWEKRYTSIGIIGHSMGGAICILEAAKDKRPKFVISITGTANTSKFGQRHFSKKQLEEIQKTGFTKWFKERREEWLVISKEFIDDLSKHNPLQAVKKIKRPILFIISTADEFSMRKRAFDAAKQPKTLIVLKGADHNFRIKGKMKEMTYALVSWIKEIGFS